MVFATAASAANTLSNQLREQGKKAVVFGTDGAYSPSQYKPRNGYVSVFARDLHFVERAFARTRVQPLLGDVEYFGAPDIPCRLRRHVGDHKRHAGTEVQLEPR